MPKFECDQCGACCRQLIVEADELDVLREPRLIDADRHYAGKSVDEVVDELQSDVGKVLVIVCSSGCRFVGTDNQCTIYPTRPNVCVAMQAGDEQCQTVRQAEGLEPLAPSEPPG